jgi:lipoprotein-releasing system permease protein
MYKPLLCWRYLLTRYLALACIISVMLGVATLIVVNSVMSGFSTKLRERLHGLLSDILVEARSLDGFPGPEEKMARIRQDPFLRDKVAAMTATTEVPAMLQYKLPGGETMTRAVRLIGIDAKTRGEVGGFQEHLVSQRHDAAASFAVSPELRERYFRRNPLSRGQPAVALEPTAPGQPPPPAPPESRPKEPHGVIVGHLIANFRVRDGNKYIDYEALHRGDEVILATVSGQRLAPVYDSFVMVDTFKSEMSEYDSNYVFVPLDYLQHLRTMEDRVTSIQIRLKDYADAPAVKEALRRLFPDAFYQVETWEDKQGPLLQAIAIEKGILNVLLFLIIGVAGFGILAIFSMIVTEKTRDIGILKALGASNGGVMLIFLGYGLLLGVVGAGLGTLLGVTLSEHINDVETWLAWLTGQEIFNRQVYYFDSIPTDTQPLGVVLVAAGAVLIAVTFSVLPALRAALLHPVRALRYE